VGRGHLSLTLLVVLLAAAASAAAASSIPWRIAAHGVATGAPPSDVPVAVLVASKPGTARIVARVPASAARAARAVNYRTSVLVGVFGPFGCTDARITVARIVEHGRTLIVRLVRKPLPPGTMECLAIFTTYRLLVVPRSALARVPTAARVTLAGA